MQSSIINEKQQNSLKQKSQYKSNILKKQVSILSGFFPVFIYFPLPSIDQSKQIKQLSSLIQSFLVEQKINFEILKQKHITVTRTLNILQGQIDPLKKKLQSLLKGRIILPIILLFKGIKILQNFVCLEVQKITHQRLKKITQIIGEVVHNPYFQNPIYHVSLFKLLQRPQGDIKTRLEQIRLISKKSILLSQIQISAGIKRIKLNIK